MISMTDYWVMFESDLKALLKADRYYLNHRIVKKTFQLVEMGKLMEVFDDKDKMIAQARAMGDFSRAMFKKHVIIAGKPKPLPDIKDVKSLLFALIYYKHLSNARHIQYDGNITTYFGINIKPTVIKRVAAKIPHTLEHAKKLKEKIDEYCRSAGIVLNEDLLLPSLDYDRDLYISQLQQMLPKPLETDTELMDETSRLKLDVSQRRQELNQAKEELDSFLQLVHTYHGAKHSLDLAKAAYQKRSLATKIFAWFYSWFFTDTVSQHLAKAESDFQRCQQAVFSEMPSDTTVESHVESLKSPISAAIINYNLAKAKRANHVHEERIKEEEEERALLKLQEKAKATPSFKDQTIGFFSQNMPSSETLALTGAAMAFGYFAMTYGSE